MKTIALLLMFFIGPLTFGQSLRLDLFYNKKDLDSAVKYAVVTLIRINPELSKNYEEQMDLTLSHLEPDDYRRIEGANTAFLFEGMLSLWTPSVKYVPYKGSLACNSEMEISSYKKGTMLVGFETRYLGETTYGFWSSVEFTYNFCESIQGNVEQAEIQVTHKRWIKQELVEELLGL
ncbi:MAG: hypothetical protein GY909_01725 [Oligoflexia bacterium]|nr:hypothetical protein [Oligoflexia bacterium]